MKERRLSGPAALYRRTLNSSAQRHSAESVRKSRTTQSLCSRFADVLSLEYTRQQLLRPTKADHGLLCNIRPSVITSTGQSSVVSTSATAAAASFDLTQTSTAGNSLMLRSPSLRQLSLTADDTEPLVASCRTPGDFPSNLLLAPITAPCRQTPRHHAAQHRVS